MKKEERTKLEGGISTAIKSIPYYDGQNEDEIKKLLTIARAESKYIAEEDSASVDLKTKETKLELDRERFEHEKEIDNQRLEIEKIKAEIERDRLAFERESKLEEYKRNRSERIFNAVIKGCEIAIPVGSSILMFLISARLVYADDGRLPSEMRDLWSKVLRMK